MTDRDVLHKPMINVGEDVQVHEDDLEMKMRMKKVKIMIESLE